MYIKCGNRIFNLDKMVSIYAIDKFLVIHFDGGRKENFELPNKEEANKELERISKFAQSSGIAVYRMGMRK